MEYKNTLEFKIDLSVDTIEKLKKRTEEFVKIVENEIKILDIIGYSPNINFFTEEAIDGSESALIIQLS